MSIDHLNAAQMHADQKRRFASITDIGRAYRTFLLQAE
jgi:hypothetical protein